MLIDKKLHKRLLEICYKNEVHHLGSHFSSIDIIDNIYDKMHQDDIFILSNGHAAVALYAVIEKYFGINAENLLKEFGDHPVLSENNKIFCSTGSLGMGITVAIGRALANKKRKVYCMISDGECSEGSVWESLKYLNILKLNNLVVHLNMNGWGAFHEINQNDLENMLNAFYPEIKIHKTTVEHYGLSGQEARVKLNKKQYEKALEAYEKRFCRLFV